MSFADIVRTHPVAVRGLFLYLLSLVQGNGAETPTCPIPSPVCLQMSIPTRRVIFRMHLISIFSPASRNLYL